MKTNCVLLILVCFSFIDTQAQESVAKIIEGSCFEVIDYLKKEMRNDSLAIKTFMDDYIIIDSSLRLSKKSYKEVVSFFNKAENKHYRCYLKEMYYKHYLLKETTEYINK